MQLNAESWLSAVSFQLSARKTLIVVTQSRKPMADR
jgi:hypothetical protein